MLVSGGMEYQLKKRVLYMTGPGVFHEQITDKADFMSEYCIGCAF